MQTGTAMGASSGKPAFNGDGAMRGARPERGRVDTRHSRKGTTMAGRSAAREGRMDGCGAFPKWALVSLVETLGELLFLPVAVFCIARNVFRMNLEDWPEEG
jgi:hypothetical protein